MLSTHFDAAEQPIEVMSVTKSVVNLAIGRLYSERLVTLIDQLVHECFPEQRQGRKQAIALQLPTALLDRHRRLDPSED